jgi:hypothetical protein
VVEAGNRRIVAEVVRPRDPANQELALEAVGRNDEIAYLHVVGESIEHEHMARSTGRIVRR